MSTTFLRKHFIQELEAVYKAFPDEKYVGFQEMTKPIILIRDPQLMKNIVVKDFDHFVDHKEFFSVEFDPLFGGSLFSMNGDKWREMRTTLSPAFTSSKMKFMFPLINEISLNNIQYLNDHEGEDIDVDDIIRRYTNDVIALAGFGFQVNSLKDRDNEFYKAGNGLFDFDFRQRVLILLEAQFPQLIKKFRLRLFKDSVYDFFFKIVASALEYRRKENIERPDMIQLLMQAKREWKLEELTSQVFIFFTAGFETSASSLFMTIHELALNKTIQDRLYEECRQLNEEKELTFETISELKYLDAILNETLRIWCPAILLDRKCTKTYELPPPREGGKPYVLKPGDIVYNLVNQVQMDSKYWPEPHKYNPDRFLDENKNNITPFTFMPFGVGPRGCIGLRFAILQFKVLMFHLILNFDIVKTDKTSDPIKLQTRTFNIGADGGTSVQFKRRDPK
ncbi:unnamed protein product [Arctia plantaginis]|uniref:unspecific monooxygenase n=1 Tax=Arctia plantaginis TaxID=874455 RepID=A0A8S1B281_ARCPL|nr:unnamed protein product [Arctia plantaginis]